MRGRAASGSSSPNGSGPRRRGTPDHRQMTAADLELPPIDNVVTLERKKA
jgi:hypothetical protein